MFTVLCVDTDQRRLTFLKQLFSTQVEFHILAEAHNSGEAIAQASRLKPDIVLIDLAMLHETDFAPAQSIKNILSQTQIVIMTGKSQIPYQTTALDNGADAFVSKAHLDTDLFPVMRSVAAPRSYETNYE
jgi:DNA-binding NarL/FixJ family response regulator